MMNGFTDLCAFIPGLRAQIRYATGHNLTGHPLAGYLQPKAIGTLEMAQALKGAFNAAQALGYGMLVYDAYRPQKSVDDFVSWSLLPQDGKTREEFYPALEKESLFPSGYIARRSGHSRGSTVDLTLLDSNGQPLDMGTCFDFMDNLSHHGAFAADTVPGRNRALLRTIMEQAGFLPYENEWWHYRLMNEPYPDTLFDFDIE